MRHLGSGDLRIWPRLLAVGPARAFVLDGDHLLAYCLADFNQPPTAVPLPPATKPEALLALGVSEDEGLLFAATANAVTAQRLDGSIAWAAATGWQRIVGLAVSGPHLLVADRAAARGVGSWCDMTVVECVREPRMVRRNAVTEDYRRDKKR